MTKHNALADSELHTPKGADSAELYQMLYADGLGATSFSHFLEDIDAGHTTVGEWDYATDGLDGSGNIVFNNLEDYGYIEIDFHDLVNSSASTIYNQVGTNSGWVTTSSYYSVYYYRSSTFDGNLDLASTAGYLGLAASSSNSSVMKIQLFNFNQAAPTLIQSKVLSRIVSSDYAMKIHTICNNLLEKTRFRVYPSAGSITGGSAYIRGIKL